MVDNAPTLKAALPQFARFIERHSPLAWGSWGKFDARQFEQETVNKSLPNPLKLVPYQKNIKQRFARKRGHRVGLARAVQLSGLSFQGRHHSGINDAKNIGRLIDYDDPLREAILKRL